MMLNHLVLSHLSFNMAFSLNGLLCVLRDLTRRRGPPVCPLLDRTLSAALSLSLSLILSRWLPLPVVLVPYYLSTPNAHLPPDVIHNSYVHSEWGTSSRCA